MFEIYPNFNKKFYCPFCQKELTSKEIQIPGMRVVADTYCPNCQKEFYADLPIRHNTILDCILDKETGETYNLYGNQSKNKESFYSRELKQAFTSKKENHNIEFQEINKQENDTKKEELIIINCLDPCYGHSLFALLNSQYYLDNHPEKELLIIIPKLLSWILPKGNYRAIEVNISLAKSCLWLENLNSHLKKIFEDYQKVYLSECFYPQPDYIDINRFIPECRPFDISKLGNKEKPTITFLTREDHRLWIQAGPFFKKVKKLKNSHRFKDNNLIKKISLYYQRLSIIQLYQELQKIFPDVDFAVMGTAKTGTFPKEIKDLRNPKPNKETELQWAKRLSQTQVAIGIHGSNVILPSLLSGSTIKLLHNFKPKSIIQDLLPNEKEPRMALVRYRHLPTESSIFTAVKNIQSIINNFSKTYSWTKKDQYYDLDPRHKLYKK